MPPGSLGAVRDPLIADPHLSGLGLCHALSDATDGWLASLADEASGGSSRKIALLAIGGYGRRELCPHSDLDLLLLHDSRRDIAEVAERLWYPLWDQGLRVDHAVRRPKEALKVAEADLRAALGLLDARVIWGDVRIAEPLLEKVRGLWRSKLAKRFLPSLQEQMEERHRSEGDVAFLLEPDLKEGHGGLRDVNVLEALASCSPRLAELVDIAALKRSSETLLTVRVELHRISGRCVDRMLLQEQDAVASALSYADADALCRSVSEAGRSIARISDETWRRRRLWEPGASTISDGQGGRELVEDGIVDLGDEISLDVDAAVASDRSLPWRLAAVAAERDKPVSLGALHRLAEHSPAGPSSWRDGERSALVRLLSAGHRAIPPFEALDEHGLVARQLPEWVHVRHHHQRNAYHRFTVDRHLLETAANAAEISGDIERADLLLLGALLHDIGKGLPGDHTEVGIGIVEELGPRLGLSGAEVAVLATLVRHHLLLADTATRRDLSDPKTIDTVARAVGDVETLEILAALTQADSLATGPAAWGSWKAQLTAELVERTRARLEGAEAVVGEAPGSVDTLELAQQATISGRPAISLEPPQLVVAAPDRPGLLSDVAGVLALNGLTILSADVSSAGDVALDSFAVETTRGRWPRVESIESDLASVLDGEADLEELLASRAATYAGASRTWAAQPTRPSVRVDNEASASATVVEVHAMDEMGLLHRLTRALWRLGLDVTAARVATIGGEVVDAFYLRDARGSKLTDAADIEALEAALGAIIGT